jgi:phosphatidylglycerol lysyltransferase
MVAAHGVFILASTLVDEINARRGVRSYNGSFDIALLVGMGLLYLSSLLRRQKRTALYTTVTVYIFYLGSAVNNVLQEYSFTHRITIEEVIRFLLLPLAVLALLYSARSYYIVRSDSRGFRAAAQISLVVLLAALIYGVVGFTSLDGSDFHQEITVTSAVHYTIDQFDLTTRHPIHAYTRRAKLFTDSLSYISVIAVGYALISLFQPLRSRLQNQAVNRDHVLQLLVDYGGLSEDYFKIWPRDKQYFFESTGNAGVAYTVRRRVALCLGDPIGNSDLFENLLHEFEAFCFGNDWTVSLIHIQDIHQALYEAHDYELQKIGEEAVVYLEQFCSITASNKYFRNIKNKFSKQGYSYEYLLPPHHEAVIQRLNAISIEWLSRPGRVERRFAQGYFSTAYMQLCPVFVVRDAAGTIQAFINKIPAAFDTQEATYDLLRHSSASLGNINDFLLLGFTKQLKADGYQQLNLGLSPLVGLDDVDKSQRTLVNNLLRLAYTNGDRFYSFSGLHRFKAKYEPDWRDRYVAYQGGIRGFTSAMNALNQAMRVKHRVAKKSK